MSTISRAVGSKRCNPVKVMLRDDELAAATAQALAQDLAVSEVIRKGWLLATFGTIGLAQMRAKRNRGSDEFLEDQDFQSTGFGEQGL